MKTTFTLLVILALSIGAFAKHSNPFIRYDRSSATQHQLKSGHLRFMPASITLDTWDLDSWIFSNTTNYEYDEHGNVLVMTTAESRTTNTYDTSDRIIQAIVAQYDDGLGIYVNTSKTTYSYDTNGNLSETTGSDWTGTDWNMVSGTRNVIEYDSHGYLSMELYSYYSPILGWIETSGWKIESTYSGDLLTQEIEYDRENGIWVHKEKTEYFYDGNDIAYMAHEYEHDGSNFVLIGRYTDVSWYIWGGHVDDGSYLFGYTYQTYNGSGDINNGDNYTNDEKMTATYEGTPVNGIPPTMVETYFLWIGGKWENDTRETTEQKDNYVSYMEEEWDGAQWLTTTYYKTYTTPTMIYHLNHTYGLGVLVSADKITSIFDTHGNLTELKSEHHDGDENWMQTSGSEYNITYEGATAKMLERITKVWNGSIYVNSLRETFDYAATNIETETTGESVYPTIISSEINIVSAQDGVATFYSLTGSVALQKQVYAGTNNVSTAALPAGYYILKVNSNTFKVIKK